VSRDPFDRWLEEEFAAKPPAPAGFTDRVMAQVEATPQLQPTPARHLWDEARDLAALPWWVRVAMEPSVVLATIVAGACLAWGPQLLQAANGLLAGVAAASPAPWTAPLQTSRVTLIVTLALAPSVVWMSARLYCWGRGLAAR
jgi:hypothetical protein